jgi:putative FmdB family regulatory protein
VPTYDYICSEGHEFEAVRGYDDETIDCECGAKATRQAVYPGQGVIFKGMGFTKSVLPPAPPKIPSTASESTAVDFEQKDEYAKESYDHDKNVRPYVKEEKKKELKK